MASKSKALMGFATAAVAGMLLAATPALAGRPVVMCDQASTSVSRSCRPGVDPYCTCILGICNYVTQTVVTRNVRLYFPQTGETVDGRADVPTYFQARLYRKDGTYIAGPKHATPDWIVWWKQLPNGQGWVQQKTWRPGYFLMDDFPVPAGEYWIGLGYGIGDQWTWQWAPLYGPGIVHSDGSVTTPDHCRY
jgi:hypothetical protein